VGHFRRCTFNEPLVTVAGEEFGAFGFNGGLGDRQGSSEQASSNGCQHDGVWVNGGQDGGWIRGPVLRGRSGFVDVM
jgi:hypothetical protein